MTLNDIPAYIEVVRPGDDEPVTGVLTACEADRVVATAVRRGYVLEPAAQGVIVIRRPGTRVVVELRPTCRPSLTSWQAKDLALLTTRQARVRVRREGVILTAGLDRIPPAATRRLLHRGWLSCVRIREGEPVSVSVAGRFALVLYRHRTRTSQPRGWHRAADNPYGPQVVGRGPARWPHLRRLLVGGLLVRLVPDCRAPPRGRARGPPASRRPDARGPHHLIPPPGLGSWSIAAMARGSPGVANLAAHHRAADPRP